MTSGQDDAPFEGLHHEYADTAFNCFNTQFRSPEGAGYSRGSARDLYSLPQMLHNSNLRYN